MEWSSRWSRIKRASRSVPEGYVAVLITGCVALIGVVSRGVGARWLVTWLTAGLVVSFVLILFQSYLKYVKDKYDPTLALHYEEIFDKEMGSARSEAAQALKDNKHHLSEVDNADYKKKLEVIDPVLDFLDTLGFYLKAEQISDAVMHQHFYYWIRGYWLAAQAYVNAWRSKPGEGPRWEHIETLFDATCEVECSRGKTMRERERGIDIDKFLDEEIGNGEEAH